MQSDLFSSVIITEIYTKKTQKNVTYYMIYLLFLLFIFDLSFQKFR